MGNASIYDAINLITTKGGLAIPAHIDGSDQAVLNLYELTGGAMKNMLENEHLRAVEIVDPEKFSRPDKKLKLPLKECHPSFFVYNATQYETICHNPCLQ